MEREIKFRAWDGVGKKMIGKFFNANDFKKYPCLIQKEEGAIFCGDWDKSGDWNEPILMEFTGLVDKYQIDIYEGDILRFVGGTATTIRCGNYDDQFHSIGKVLIVSKLNSGFTLQEPKHLNNPIPSLVGNVNNYHFWNHHKSFEKIGNIHENPELLE